MAQKWLERPREVILGEVSRLDVRNPQQNALLEPTRSKRFTLPPIHSQAECRRFKTQTAQDDHCQDRELRRLGTALKMTRSKVLTQVTDRLPSLEAMHLIQGGAIRTIRYSGHIRIPTVHNDYHNSKTNAGYSRNKMGGIYPK